MRPALVVVDSPPLDDFASFGDRGEHVVVEAFVPKLPVEALDEGVLRRLSRRNVMQLYAMLSRPRKHCETCQLGAVIHHDGFWQSAFVGDPIEYAANASTADRGVDFDREGFTREVVDDIQRS